MGTNKKEAPIPPMEVLVSWIACPKTTVKMLEEQLDWHWDHDPAVPKKLHLKVKDDRKQDLLAALSHYNNWQKSYCSIDNMDIDA